MKNLLILTTIFLFTRCEPIPTQSVAIQKKMVFDDYNYEDLVGMVQLLPSENGELKTLESPVIGLNDNQSLFLQFDLLTDQFEYLAVKISHCNKDWSPSILRDMEFMREINVFRITEYDFSLNTTQPYINYRFEVPKPFLSGNYLLSVFRRGNPKDILFNRKFLIVSNQSTIDQQVKISNTVSKRDVNQQIDFSVSYGNIPANNPIQDISVVLLQNHKWLDAISDIQPSLIRPNENYLEFRMLNLENNFPGWNEFRFFDLRTLSVTGRNVSRIVNNPTQIEVQLGADESRGSQVYTQNLRDVNGNFILQNTDPGDIPLNSDYANVSFFLKSKPLSGSVFVTGRFNNWKLSDENIMQYDSRTEGYRTKIQLKQGYYDYLYYVESDDTEPYKLEGSHLLTENDYEILVYYRRPGNVNDELIGYKKFNSQNQ